VVLGALALPVRADKDRVDDKKVRGSIKLGVAYLTKKQSAEGHWEAPVAFIMRGGATSLALLALLEAGVPATDAKVQKGLAYLRKVEPSSTYVVSLQTMAFIRGKQAVDRERISRNVKWLLKARGPDGWGYGGGERGGLVDNSNSQYALLAIHEAIQAGHSVPREALQAVQKLYLDTQVDGGWSYTPRRDKRTTFTMTTAGLCNLVITGNALHIGKIKLRPDGSAVDCGVYDETAAVGKAIEWLGNQFPREITAANAGPRFDSPYYALSGLERAGRLTGQRFFGGHDWYEVGCRFLVSTQKPDGHWEHAPGGRNLDRHPLIATSFALLFLSKGRTPVLISKLAYGQADYNGWNNKRNDVKHLVEFASREVFRNRPLAWQAFDVRERELKPGARKQLAQELLASPIVYFNGHDSAPRGELRNILKEYVENGGFILAENCCGKARHPAFDRDLRKLVEDLFPKAELRPVPQKHPLWRSAGKWVVSPRDCALEGVEVGGRLVLVYSPVPLAGYWEGNLHKEGRGQTAFRVGAAIIAYATGLKVPPARLEKRPKN
jgi:hypothetical protein